MIEVVNAVSIFKVNTRVKALRFITMAKEDAEPTLRRGKRLWAAEGGYHRPRYVFAGLVVCDDGESRDRLQRGVPPRGRR